MDLLNFFRPDRSKIKQQASIDSLGTQSTDDTEASTSQPVQELAAADAAPAVNRMKQVSFDNSAFVEDSDACIVEMTSWQRRADRMAGRDGACSSPTFISLQSSERSASPVELIPAPSLAGSSVTYSNAAFDASMTTGSAVSAWVASNQLTQTADQETLIDAEENLRLALDAVPKKMVHFNFKRNKELIESTTAALQNVHKAESIYYARASFIFNGVYYALGLIVVAILIASLVYATFNADTAIACYSIDTATYNEGCIEMISGVDFNDTGASTVSNATTMLA